MDEANIKEKEEIEDQDQSENYGLAERRKKELYWIVGIMSTALLFLLITPSIVNSMNTFEYRDMAFSKIKEGNLTLYHYYYFFSDLTGQQYKHNIYLRIDPRKNNVPVTGFISYPSQGDTIYLAINATELVKCPNVLRDVATLSSFLADNLFKVKSGTVDAEEAKETNHTYISCEKYPNDTVINLQTANETSITQNGTCYFINVADCKILDVVEKFEVQSILDAKKFKTV